MIFEPILAFFLIRHLRKTLQTFSPNSVWDKVLIQIMYGTAALFALQFVLHIGNFTIWIWHLLLISLCVAAYKKQEFSRARNMFLATMPFAFLIIVSEISKNFSDDFFTAIKKYLDYAYPVAITWAITMLIISGRQRKALEKEQRIRLAEEERNKIVSARKAELEVLVAERTAELTQQKEELEHALLDLKATQTQLIQREKMASLGELTAGIAHEIQNPLNFVNNFSEVSDELIDEMKTELQTGNWQLATEIANDVKQNLEKILHHGKRADAIVKGMLQHSRTSTGQKELTDINALADEYLQLSYHGLRAKDKSFNAILQTNFDTNIEKINIVPQDIGRVLLNLFNNAFYAVSERRKVEDAIYEPTVSVYTKRSLSVGEPVSTSREGRGEVEIHVCDNGKGIPQKIVDKIFQPFFTTKPAGEGTGLGLSLSYDIIKAHGGEIKVETKEGEGTEFVITLPVTGI